MAEKITRLAYIMSRLGVRAEEMSKRTGIDKTLISRWKNGQRRLSPTSNHSKDISVFLLGLDKADSVVRKTLSAYGLDERSGSLQDNLIFWLTEQDIPSPSLRNTQQEADINEYTASFRVFLGGDGLRSAIITLIDYVMTLPGPQNIVAVVLSDFSWVTEDPDFFELLVERLSTAFERGVVLTMIGRDELSENIARFSALWLAAHLRGYIKSYYYKDEPHQDGEKIFVAVKDGVALRLEHDPAAEEGLYTAMFTDNVTVRRLYNVAASYLTEARAQFRYNFFPKPGAFLHSVQQKNVAAADCYVCAAVPSLGAIDRRHAHLFAQGTLRDTKQRTEQVRSLFTTPDQFESTAKVRHIYCMEKVEELLKPGRTMDYPLSAIYEKRVHHSRKLVLRQLADIRAWMQELDNYEAVFVPAHVYERIPLEFMCVQNNFCAGWPADASTSTCVKDRNKVAALFGFAAQQWDELPKYCKDHNRTLHLLDRWLAD